MSAILSTDGMAADLATALHKTHHAVAPLKSKKVIENKRSAPWYTDHTRALNLKSCQLECRWRSTKLQVFLFAWKENLDAYKHALSSVENIHFFE